MLIFLYCLLNGNHEYTLEIRVGTVQGGIGVHGTRFGGPFSRFLPVFGVLSFCLFFFWWTNAVQGGIRSYGARFGSPFSRFLSVFEILMFFCIFLFWWMKHCTRRYWDHGARFGGPFSRFLPVFEILMFFCLFFFWWTNTVQGGEGMSLQFSVSILPFLVCFWNFDVFLFFKFCGINTVQECRILFCLFWYFFWMTLFSSIVKLPCLLKCKVC